MVSENNKYLGHFESCLSALHKKADKRLDTEIVALSDDLHALTRCVVKVEDDLAKLYSTCNGQMKTLWTLCRTQDQILSRFDGFGPEQAETRLTQLEAVPTSSIPQLLNLYPLPVMLSPVLPRGFGCTPGNPVCSPLELPQVSDFVPFLPPPG